MTNIPGEFPGMPEGPNEAAVRRQVSTPAILLMVTAGLGIALALLGLVQSLLGHGGIPPELLDAPNFPPQLRPWLERSQSLGAFSNVLALGLSGFTFYGALRMKDLRDYGLAMAASIIAIIPCLGPCCCIGIPVGIWSLVVLNKPEVKAAFR